MEVAVIVLVSIVGGFGLFIGIWVLVTSLLRTMARMTRKLDVDTGRLLRESSWGSGTINGIRARGCLRVAEHENGWVLRMAWVFGGGKLWLPKSGATIGRPKPGGLFSSRSLTIEYAGNRVHLYGSLGDFVAQNTFVGKNTANDAAADIGI